MSCAPFAFALFFAARLISIKPYRIVATEPQHILRRSTPRLMFGASVAHGQLPGACLGALRTLHRSQLIKPTRVTNRRPLPPRWPVNPKVAQTLVSEEEPASHVPLGTSRGLYKHIFASIAVGAATATYRPIY
jgi:hypothetical protein